MKKEELFSALGNVDEEYIRDARMPERKQRWGKWLALAAALGMVVGVGVGTYATPGIEEPERPTADESVGYEAVGFAFGDAIYFPIDFESRIRYGLLPEDAIGLTRENTYRITEDDLGEPMGTVKLADGTASAYHFASYPELDSICIVETNDGYAFYTADSLLLPEGAEANSDGILSVYGIPDRVTELTVQTGDWETVLTITDRERIGVICAILSGKTNMGLAEHEKRFAKLWQDTYGNDDVRYDQANGVMIYRSGLTGLPEETTVTAADGSFITYVEPDTVFEENYEAAHVLWGKGERVLTFEIDRGFRLSVIYKPSIKTVSFCDGYYALTEEEVARMNALLEIE